MTMRFMLIATTALTLAACGEKAETDARATANGAGAEVSETATDVGQSEPVNAVQDAVGGVVGQVSAATANSVEGYVTNAAMSDMYEIEASQIAQTRGQSAGVKAFAKQMIEDHTATTAKVKSIIAGDNLTVTPPMALDARRKGFIDNLNAASAADFDKVYINQQVAAHEEALTLHRSYVDDGDNAKLKAFATETAPKVQMHLEMVQKLDNANG